MKLQSSSVHLFFETETASTDKRHLKRRSADNPLKIAIHCKMEFCFFAVNALQFSLSDSIVRFTISKQ